MRLKKLDFFRKASIIRESLYVENKIKQERSNAMGYSIESLLDTDFYKFTMGQLIFHRYRSVPVKFALTIRTKGVGYANIVSEEDLRRELDYARTLRFTNNDLDYLRGTNEYGDRMFKEDYLDFLKNFQLPPYHLEKIGDSYQYEVAWPWAEALYCETVDLPIFNELYYRSLMRSLSRFEKEAVYARAKVLLADKLKFLKEHPGITFSDFGTRRRHSREWQDYVVGVLAEELPRKQFLGTSNVYFANKYGLIPMGTDAHERAMAMAGIMHGSDDDIRASFVKTFTDWWDEYGWGLSIALIDTYGSDFIFNDTSGFGEWIAKEWKGMRQDSGDPILWGEKAIQFYKRHGVDPREKIAIFSDSLDTKEMYELQQAFGERTKVTTFGWGTKLMNHFPDYRTLSMVIKLIEANGNEVAKLSDNIAKAIGKPEDIERFKKIFGYSSDFYEECKT